MQHAHARMRDNAVYCSYVAQHLEGPACSNHCCTIGKLFRVLDMDLHDDALSWCAAAADELLPLQLLLTHGWERWLEGEGRCHQDVEP
jgi:hypothetical protein